MFSNRHVYSMNTSSVDTLLSDKELNGSIHHGGHYSPQGGQLFSFNPSGLFKKAGYDCPPPLKISEVYQKVENKSLYLFCIWTR